MLPDLLTDQEIHRTQIPLEEASAEWMEFRLQPQWHPLMSQRRPMPWARAQA